MKLLTLATLVGTATAFLAPAPQMARTQGRVSDLIGRFCCLLVELGSGRTRAIMDASRGPTYPSGASAVWGRSDRTLLVWPVPRLEPLGSVGLKLPWVSIGPSGPAPVWSQQQVPPFESIPIQPHLPCHCPPGFTHRTHNPQMYMADQAPVDDELRSIALPFAAKPQNLNGELVGDVGKLRRAGRLIDRRTNASMDMVGQGGSLDLSGTTRHTGFDPFKFSDKGDLAKFRVAELKHGT